MAVVFQQGGGGLARRDPQPYAGPVAAGGAMAPSGLAGQIVAAVPKMGGPRPGFSHPIHHGGPVDRHGGFRDRYSGGPMSGGTGLAHAILVGNSKTQPVNPANRTTKGGLFGLLAGAAQRAMEQKAQMNGDYRAAAQDRMRALQQLSANLHAGR